MRTSILLGGTALVMLVGIAHASLTGASHFPVVQDPCTIQLYNQSAVAECMPPGNINCGGTGATCCDHFHASMNWKICGNAGFHTGSVCNMTPTQKHYNLSESHCEGMDCLHGFWSTCTTHYEDNYSLLGCVED